MCFTLWPAVIGSASPLRLSLLQHLLPSCDLHLSVFYQTFPEGHPDVVLTASAEHCHFMDSLKDTFLWVMSPQPSDSSRVAASKCWEEPLVPQGGTHGPKPRASSRRDSPGGKGAASPCEEGDSSPLWPQAGEGGGLRPAGHSPPSWVSVWPTCRQGGEILLLSLPGSGVSVAGKSALTLISLRPVRKQGRQGKPKAECAPESHGPASERSTCSEQKGESAGQPAGSDSESPWTVAHRLLRGPSQARTLKWVCTSFCGGSSRPRGQAQISCTAGRFFTIWASRLIIAPSKDWNSNSEWNGLYFNSLLMTHFLHFRYSL